jgi:hypothetical protein
MTYPSPCPGLVADQAFPHPDFTNPLPGRSGFQQPDWDGGSTDKSVFVNLDTSTININEMLINYEINDESGMEDSVN